MILKYMLIGLMALFWPTLGFKLKNVETRTALLFLDENGDLTDTTAIPDCGTKKIMLKSYTYNQMECTRVSCKLVGTEALSEATIVQLYQNCSFRQKCENLGFPNPTSLQNDLNANGGVLRVTVEIQYQCTDEEIIELNMCEEHTVTFDYTIHLTLDDFTWGYRECQCWVNKGAFSLIMIMDLRLKSRSDGQCTTIEMLIDNNRYACDSGPVFEEMVTLINKLEPNAFISLLMGSGTSMPEMVRVAVKPEGTSRLECVSPETFTLTGARQTEPEPISRSHDIFSKTKRQRLVTKADLDRATSIVSNTSAISINQTNGSATRDDFHDYDSDRDDGTVSFRLYNPRTDAIIAIIVTAVIFFFIGLCVRRTKNTGKTKSKFASCFAWAFNETRRDGIRRWQTWFGAPAVHSHDSPRLLISRV